MYNNSFFNENHDWGPKRDPLFTVIPITILYVLIFLVGILGNVSTCIVISGNKCMHTATNYYLFSLAVSDLLLLISGLPQEIYFIWSKYPYIFGEDFCRMQGFISETSANATVLTITAFTVERYIAICYPFLSHTHSKLNRAFKYIILTWIIAMSLAIPQVMAMGIVCEIVEGYPPDEFCVCTVKKQIIPHAFEISFFVFFVGPMSLLTVLYILIAMQLRMSNVNASRGNSVKMRHRYRYRSPVVGYVNHTAQVLVINRNGTGGIEAIEVEDEGRRNYGNNYQSTKHVIKMLVAVVVAFFICWAPFHAQRLLAIYGAGARSSEDVVTTFQILTYVSGIFYYLSTTINPLLYHIMSNKFRMAFKRTYQKLFRKHEREKIPGCRCYSTLSVPPHSNSDSCSGSLRYLEDSLAERLCDHNLRPLVISYKKRRKIPQNQNIEVFNTDTKEPTAVVSRLSELSQILLGEQKEQPRREKVMNIKNSFSSPIILSKYNSPLTVKENRTTDNNVSKDSSEIVGRHCNSVPSSSGYPCSKRQSPDSSEHSFNGAENLTPTHLCSITTRTTLTKNRSKERKMSM